MCACVGGSHRNVSLHTFVWRHFFLRQNNPPFLVKLTIYMDIWVILILFFMKWPSSLSSLSSSLCTILQLQYSNKWYSFFCCMHYCILPLLLVFIKTVSSPSWERDREREREWEEPWRGKCKLLYYSLCLSWIKKLKLKFFVKFKSEKCLNSYMCGRFLWYNTILYIQ